MNQKPVLPISPLSLAAAVTLALASGFGQAAQQASAECKPAPLGEQQLFLRGGMNAWNVSEDYAFTYTCDAYYLNVDENGAQEFKIADPAWTPATTFGGGSEEMIKPGIATPLLRGSDPRSPGNLKFRFTGPHTIRMAFDEGRATLTVGAKTRADANAKPLNDATALSLSHDSRALADKAPFGSVVAGSPLAFALNALPGVSGVTLVVEKRRLEGNQEVLEYTEQARVTMQRHPGSGRERWTASHVLAEPGVYGYYFEAVIAGQTYIYQNNRAPVYWTRERGSNGLGLVQHQGATPRTIRRFRQTVYARDFAVPGWAKDAVHYYIFPERFRNGDTRNDPLPGKHSYHDKTVEFHDNWLDKPYRPGSGDGSDKFASNDFFGGDLQGVIDKLDYIKELGANTIYMTPVFRAASNHKYDTADYRNIDPHFGSNADYARLSREAAKRGIRIIADASFNHTGSDSVYFDRFAKYPAKGAFEGAQVQPSSPYASWYTFDASQSDPNRRYKGWSGALDLPELNKASPAFRKFAYGSPDGVTQLWLDRGAAGWRMDVAPWVPDDFWREWRKAVKKHRKDALTIAETWFDSSKYFLGDTFDTTMNYIFRNAVLDYAAGAKASVAYQNIELMREAYPRQSFYALMNLLSTHDQARSLHVLGDSGPEGDPALARQRFKLAVLFQMVFPGAPAIYYGDEVGLSGGDDPANRAGYPWADKGGKPDLALLADFKAMIAMRKQHPVLRHGSIDAPLHIDDNVIVLARRHGTSWAITATNNAAEPKTISVALPKDAPQGFVDALTGTAATAKDGSITLTVPALFGTVLVNRHR